MPHMANLPWIFLSVLFVTVFVLLFSSLMITPSNTLKSTNNSDKQNKKTMWQW